jgi:short-subunit dehydrogenase
LKITQWAIANCLKESFMIIDLLDKIGKSLPDSEYLYITSKFGVVGFSEGLYAYLRPKGIMVSVLCPGGVLTISNQMCVVLMIGSNMTI